MRKLWYAAAAILVVAAVAAAAAWYLRRSQEWEQRVEREITRAQLAMGQATSLAFVADSLEQVADSLAVEAARRDTVIQRVLVELPAPPPECEEFTAPRDSVIALMEDRHVSILTAFEQQREATAKLRIAERAAYQAADSLLSVLKDRPLPKPGWVPEVSAGVFAGMCTNAQPCAGVGVGITWRVRLF